jgi:ATP-dependent protease ClpP protease subunit
MEATLKIYGDIGQPNKMMEMFGMVDDTVSAKDISNFLEDNKDATSITVRINSRGGDVQEGWTIYDLLTTSGKKIKTIGEGKIYSIATIIYLAGSEREIMKNADGLIHNPYIPEYTLAGAYGSDDLLKIAEGLAQEEEKILNFYAERTGSDRAKLAEYMKEDTKLSAEDMLSLGFATKIIEPVKAYALYKPINRFKMEEKDVKTFGEKLDAIIAKVSGFSRLPVTDQTLVDIDGKEFKLDKEAGEPVVGDKASPDGVYTMASGKVVTVSAGAVTDISTPDSELDKANAKIAELEAKIALAEIEKVNLTVAETAFKTKEAEAQALVDELSKLKNEWKPDTRTRFGTADKVGEIDLNQVREIIAKIKSKKE